jgi:hypothetical protein
MIDQHQSRRSRQLIKHKKYKEDRKNYNHYGRSIRNSDRSASLNSTTEHTTDSENNSSINNNNKDKDEKNKTKLSESIAVQAFISIEDEPPVKELKTEMQNLKTEMIRLQNAQTTLEKSLKEANSFKPFIYTNSAGQCYKFHFTLIFNSKLNQVTNIFRL